MLTFAATLILFSIPFEEWGSIPFYPFCPWAFHSTTTSEFVPIIDGLQALKLSNLCRNVNLFCLRALKLSKMSSRVKHLRHFKVNFGVCKCSWKGKWRPKFHPNWTPILKINCQKKKPFRIHLSTLPYEQGKQPRCHTHVSPMALRAGATDQYIGSLEARV